MFISSCLCAVILNDLSFGRPKFTLSLWYSSEQRISIFIYFVLKGIRETPCFVLSINVWKRFSVVLNTLRACWLLLSLYKNICLAECKVKNLFNFCLSSAFSGLVFFLLQKTRCVSVSLCTGCLFGEDAVVNFTSQKDCSNALTALNNLQFSSIKVLIITLPK